MSRTSGRWSGNLARFRMPLLTEAQNAVDSGLWTGLGDVRI